MWADLGCTAAAALEERGVWTADDAVWLGW